jgi:hypothetical protein
MQRGMEGTPAEGTPAASTSGLAVPKTPWRTPPPMFAEVQTPLTALPASGWEQHYDAPDDAAQTDDGAQSPLLHSMHTQAADATLMHDCSWTCSASCLAHAC